MRCHNHGSYIWYLRRNFEQKMCRQSNKFLFSKQQLFLIKQKQCNILVITGILESTLYMSLTFRRQATQLKIFNKEYNNLFLMSSSLWAPNRSPWSLKTNGRITDSACLLFVLRTPADGPIIRTRRAEAETHVKVAVNKPLRAGVWDLGLWELQADINWLITEATCLPVAGCNNKCAVWRSPAVVLKCLYRKKRSWEMNFTCRVMTSCRNIFKCQTLSFL